MLSDKTVPFFDYFHSKNVRNVHNSVDNLKTSLSKLMNLLSALKRASKIFFRLGYKIVAFSLPV